MHWVAQISANLLRDEELVDLIAASGGKWVFIGMESIDTENLASVNKGFNKPGEYAAVLERLAKRNVYAITSFIFGMDNDTPGVAERTLKEIHTWPPGLPIFGLLTPLPATPLYKRLEAAGRLTRPKHWAGVHSICDGPHAAEDDDRGSPRRGKGRMGKRLQPRGDRPWLSIRSKASRWDIRSIFSSRECVSGESISRKWEFWRG